MNPLLLLWGGAALLAAGVKAGIDHLEKREQRRRLDPSTWRTEDVARLMALKQGEMAREHVLQTDTRGAITHLEQTATGALPLRREDTASLRREVAPPKAAGPKSPS